MNNKVYDILKWIAQVVLPALITLYGVIGTTCGIPYTEQIITIAVAVDTCLGTILGISSHQYKKIFDETDMDNVDAGEQ